MQTKLPLEIERKFLIEYPDITLLDSLCKGNRSEIVQTYLVGEAGASERVRARSRDGVTIYTHNTKIMISNMKRVELENEVSKEEYENLLKRADKACNVIEKTRYCIEQGSLEYEIDIFPFWGDKAFLEVELDSEDADCPMPSFVNIIRELTDDKRYTNHALAKKIPE